MESTGFVEGQHVVVEMDETTVAGHLIGMNEDGWLIKVTHKMKEVPKSLPDGAAEEVASILDELKNWELRLFLFKNRVAGWRTLGREDMLATAGRMVKQDLLADMPVVHTLKEVLSPITTFISSGIIRTMEVTDDRNMDALLHNLDFEPELSDAELGLEVKDEAPAEDK